MFLRVSHSYCICNRDFVYALQINAVICCFLIMILLPCFISILLSKQWYLIQARLCEYTEWCHSKVLRFSNVTTISTVLGTPKIYIKLYTIFCVFYELQCLKNLASSFYLHLSLYLSIYISDLSICLFIYLPTYQFLHFQGTVPVLNTKNWPCIFLFFIFLYRKDIRIQSSYLWLADALIQGQYGNPSPDTALSGT